MRMLTRVFACCSVFLMACPEQEEGPPPIFNAIDPSLQCPSGKVGWDFSTGGNETDVVPIAVGSEIKVDEVKVVCGSETANLTASFRAECDNTSVCRRPLARATDPFVSDACPRRSLTLRYRCGNEPKVYDLSMPHFSSASAAWDLIEKTPANAKTDEILLACSDVINVKGYSVLGSSGNYSAVMKDRNQCNGLRRCFSNKGADLGRTGTANAPTKYYYTCGTSTEVREASASNAGTGTRIDYSCADTADQTATEPNAAIYMHSVSFTAQAGGTGEPTAALTRLNRDFKSNCEARRSCEVDLKKSEMGQAWGTFKVEYWCGTSRGVTEKKYFHISELDRGRTKLELRCGGRLKIVGADQAWVAQQCPDGARVCSLPPNHPDTSINFFCEGTQGAMANTQAVYRTENYNLQLRERSLECPLNSARSGIQLLKNDASTVGDPLINDIAACNNKTSCLIDRGGSTQYTYICSGTNETKTSTPYSLNGRNMLYMDCRPRPTVTEISGCVSSPASQRACLPVPSEGCTVALTGSSASAATVRACTSDINVKYTCGSDPAVLVRAVPPGSFPASASPDGGDLGFDGGSLFNFTVECPYDPSPRPTASSKACIPLTCPKNTKRNAQMECEQDSTVVVYPFLGLVPFFRDPANWQEVSEIKEGFPYIKTIGMVYSGTPAVTQSQTGLMWAYDVFKKKNGTGQEVFGFRCIVSTPTVNWANGTYAALGDWQSNQASVLPSTCFNAPYGDVNSSWYHGSRFAGVNEQTFRNEYNLLRTMVVGNFDTKGKAIESWRNAPNPIGFFYTPATGYVNQLGYFAQQSDFRYQKAFRFLDSTQIELKAVSGKLDQPPLEINAESFTKPPALQMNFNWALLGDSPMHPHSPNTRLRNTDRTSLKYLNPRASLEIAKENGATNKWTADNMAVLGAVGISGGNPQEQVERITLPINPEVLKRIMSVKGTGANQLANGWMNNRIEVNSVFHARVCIDFDGIARTPGQTDIDNKFISAQVNGTTYKLGVTKRCTAEFPFTVIRDLFTRPVLPVNEVERGIDQGTTAAQGAEKVASNSDQASQQGCRKQCTVNADCGAGGMCSSGYCSQTTENVECSSGYRAGSTTGGSMGFGRSIFSAQSSGSTNSMNRTSTASNRSNVELMSYNLLASDEEQAGQTVVGTTRKEVRISLARIWSSVATIADKMSKKKTAPVRTWYKPAVMKPRGTENTLPGIAFGISKDAPIFAGPVYLQGEFSLSVGIGFDIVLKFVTDTQKQSNMNNPAYPCLGTTACLQLSTENKTFVDANEDCTLKGGRLVQARTATALTAARTAASNNNIWIGAQAAHVFEDPTCRDLAGTTTAAGLTQANLSTRLATCKAASVTQYQWISGANAGFTESYPNGTLFNQRGDNHGFGTGLTSINNDDGSPLPAGVLYKTDGKLEAHRSSTMVGTLSTGGTVTTAKYVCEYLPARAYVMNEVTLTPGVEFSFGAGAALCWPSTVIGACLAAELKFFTAGMSIEMGNRSVKVYDTETISGVQPRLTIGGSGTVGKAELSFLAGNVGIEIRFIIGSKNFNIVSFNGIAGWSTTLWDTTDRFAR